MILISVQKSRIQMGDQKLCQMLDSSNQNEFILFWVLTGITLLLLAFCVYRIVLLRKLHIIMDVQRIHYLLLAWTIGMVGWNVVLIAVCVLNNVSYLQNKDLYNKGTSYDEYPKWVKDYLPRATSIADIFVTIILQTALIAVPYYWICNCIYYLENSQNTKGLPFKRLVKTLIRIYLVISRLGFIGLLVAMAIINGDLYFQFARIAKFGIMAESIIIVIIMAYGCQVLLYTFHSVAAVFDEQQDSKMKLKTVFLIIASLVRCVLDLVLVFSELSKYIRDGFVNGGKGCLQDPNGYRYTIFLAFAYTATNYLPCVLIFALYSPSESDQNTNMLSRSMVSSSMVDAP